MAIFKNENNYLTESEMEEYSQYEDIVMTESVDAGLFDGLDEYNTYNEASSYYTGQGGKKNIIKLDKASKMKLLTTKFAIAFGKAKKDAKVAKLQRINKTRRKLIDEITQKYNSPATKAAKEAIRTAVRDSDYLSTYASRNKNKLTKSTSSTIKQVNASNKNAQKKTSTPRGGVRM